MRSSVKLALGILTAALAAACGDPKSPAGDGPVPVPRDDGGLPNPGTGAAATAQGPAGTSGGAGPAARPAGTAAGGTATPAGTARAAQPLETRVPDAPPLTADAARRVLLDAVEAAASPDATRDAVIALAASSDVPTIRRLTESMLASGSDLGYADSEAAAAALEARLRAGDEDAVARAMALAQAGISGETAWDSFIPMLAAVRGPRQAEARSLLVRLADDPVVYTTALIALVPLRDPAAAQRFHDVATDPDEDVAARCAGAVGLLALGDPRAEAALEDLVRGTSDDLTSFDVMDGFAFPGVPEALPWIRRISDPIIAAEEENSTVEIASAAAAIAEIRGAGQGTPEDVAWLRSMLGKSEGSSDDELTVALWTLDPGVGADAVANILARYVNDMHAGVPDEELAVRILGVLGTRKGASSRQFARVVDAAAALSVTSDPKRADRSGRAWRMRIAAARAWLATHAK